jgi:hypothetical protein
MNEHHATDTDAQRHQANIPHECHVFTDPFLDTVLVTRISPSTHLMGVNVQAEYAAALAPTRAAAIKDGPIHRKTTSWVRRARPGTGSSV